MHKIILEAHTEVELGNSEVKIACAIHWEKLLLPLGSNQKVEPMDSVGCLVLIPFGCKPCMAHHSGMLLLKGCPTQTGPCFRVCNGLSHKTPGRVSCKEHQGRNQTTVLLLILLLNVLLGETGLLWD